MLKWIDNHLKILLDGKLNQVEKYFKCDAILYYWQIHPAYLKIFRDFIEQLKDTPIGTYDKDKIVIVLNTPWWSAETVEKMVDILRHHYKEVYFIVPDYAMSAGTIFCMSWDKIYMDYSSSLWPIDPQIFSNKENRYVPALWYLDKVEEMIDKAKNWKITNAELIVLQAQDLAMLRQCEQAKELSINLLEEWLAKYKFKNWTVHRTDPSKVWQAVTEAEKKARAKEIAKKLSDNKLWNSHWRFIKIDNLKEKVRIEIEDYSKNKKLRKIIREYNDLICEHIASHKIALFMHSRYFF